MKKKKADGIISAVERSRKLKWTPPIPTLSVTQALKHAENYKPLKNKTSKAIVQPDKSIGGASVLLHRMVSGFVNVTGGS